MENDRLLNVMRDTIKQYVEANKTKNKIIFLLIVLLFLQSFVSFGCFCYHETHCKHYIVESTINSQNKIEDIQANVYLCHAWWENVWTKKHRKPEKG